MWGVPGLTMQPANQLGKWFLQIAAGARERQGPSQQSGQEKVDRQEKSGFFFLLSSTPTRRVMGIWLGGETPECDVRKFAPRSARPQSRIRIATASLALGLDEVAQVGEGGNRFNSGIERAGKTWAGVETGYGGALYEARRAVKDRGRAGCEFG
jgi:hypothetical protein